MAKNRKKQRAEAVARAAAQAEITKNLPPAPPVVREPDPVVEAPPPPEKPKKQRYVRPPRVKAPPPQYQQASKGPSFVGRILGKSIISSKEPSLAEKLEDEQAGKNLLR